ncbi:MAG: protease, partial [candidate division Zixibacteria bacterium]|nr:protease [candidate division Zixibacteria bacterium]
MKKSLLLSLLIFCFVCTFAYAEEARLLRFPDVNGDNVAFVYGDDIYVAPRTGGTAVRLTSHEGCEWFPKFSPDGSRIAFTGQYDGDMAVYVMPVDGGEPQKLTFHPGIQRTSPRFGPENVVLGWHPDGRKVLYRSRKKTNDWWDGRVYFVDIDGGMPEPLPMATAGFTSLSPNMDKVAYCPIYRDFRTWKRYKGGMAQDVWIFDLKTYESQRITNWEGTDNMPMWHGKYIYFNADRTGTLNLYKFDTENMTIKQVTEFTDYDVRWPSLGPDGIAFENGGYLYVMDLPSEKVQKIDIELTTDRHTVRSGYIDVSDKIRDFDISPDAKRAVFSSRGELFTVPAKEGNTRNLTGTSGANEREPAWSPDGRWIAYISDESGEEELYAVSHNGEEQLRLTTDGYCHRYRPFWSPNSKNMAFADKTGKLFLLEVKSKDVKMIDQSKMGGLRYCSWSPDSRFIAYGKQDEDRITCIFIYSLDNEEIHQVTPGYTHDFSPVFDPDGKYLYFLSQRSFNPILSEYEFEFVNQAITNLFMIPLSAEEKSPFAPESDEVVVDGGDEDEDKKDDDDDIKVKIDFDGMHEREIGIDIPSGRYRGLSAVSGAVFFSSQPMYGLRGRVGDDKTTLHKYVIADEKLHDYAEEVSQWNITAGGGKILLKKGDKFYIENTSSDKAALEEALDLSGMEMRLDRQKEFEQIFNEVWRMERDFFYDENMHGVDWEKMRERYKVLLPHAATRHDLTYIIGEMVGELCCSHTYIGGGDYPKIEDSGIGLLGVDFEIDEEHGRYRIATILEGENWDESMRSPLRDPGMNVKEGEYL